MAEPTDTELVEKARDGDLEAFGDLMRRHYPRVAGLCANLLDNRSEADDAAQEIFIKAYRSLENFQGEAKFSTWLYRITMNHCIDVGRMSGRRKTESLDAIVEEKGESAGDLMTESTSDRKHLEAAELAQTLLAGLPYDYRQALVLRTDGMSYEEIAATMNCSLDAVKSRLKRGRKMVAGKMRRLMPSDDVNGAAKAGEPHEA